MLAAIATLACTPVQAQQESASPQGEAAATGTQDREAALKEAVDFMKSIGTQGPMTGKLGNVAEVKVSKDYIFIPKEKIEQFNKFYDNDTNPGELGAIQHVSFDHFIIFDYDDVGYVKDDEKDSLDADAILKSMQEGQDAANAERSKQGRQVWKLTGWQEPPHYDQATNRLTWATKLESESSDGVSINYNSRLLGRGGYMSAVLVVSPEKLATTIPAYNTVLQGYNYLEGQKYADWRDGDKVAAYGLAALVGGGALALAAKSGFLGKMLKPLLYGGLAVLAGISAFIKKLFGGGSKTA